MITLIVIVLLALSFSFLCSVFEAVLLSVTPSYIATLRQNNFNVAERLAKQKDNVESPLVAILTINTISHTVGAAVAGAQAAKVFGDELLGVFSAVLTFLILFFSEIIPKTIGANYWRSLAPSVSLILLWMERITRPLIWMSNKVTRLLGKGEVGQYVRQEISAMAAIGLESGELNPQESKILTQMMKARDISAHSIMTPRIVMFSLPVQLTVAEFAEKHRNRPFTRIPVYQDEPDNVIGYVTRTDLLLEAHKQPDCPIGELKQSLLVVPETAKLLPLFELMIKRNTQIAMVADEYGTGLGLVTLEDIIESLLGLEIVDVNDPATDMQKLARNLWKRRMKDKGIRLSEDNDDSESSVK
ncbi:HlyC/CorC family transporter [Shewanella avicenniae]|uniref:HlyC/CorC family transporter n=1 Tax=Shewanella avicenniae TaxID=2814294 RepID=A0ABX7QU88_9GAMM|nr:hemolysin family protein [Shewanella avicenniae]QSX34834.1 HlyC/CorC family transporter [Shewanella avicenniae]